MDRIWCKDLRKRERLPEGRVWKDRHPSWIQVHVVPVAIYFRSIARDLTYAAIDIGSNAVRLLVAEVIERDDHPVIKKQTLVRVPIRLGEDVFDQGAITVAKQDYLICLLYTSPSPRDRTRSRMPSSA